MLVGDRLPELVETALRSGQTDRAAAACERSSAIAGTSATEWARGTAACGRAQLADGAIADDLYRETIGLFSCTGMATPLARARLCYGEWLQRTNYRTEARTQLGT